MNWRIRPIFIAAIVLAYSCSTDSPKKETYAEIKADDYASTRYLIEPEELHSSLKSGSKLKLIDMRKPAKYQQGHLENAVNIWRNQIEDTSFAYGGMMPTKAQLEGLLGTLGITSTDTLIIYDDKAECDAARLWWILKFYGHENMKLLNGGLKSWIQLDSVLNIEEPKFEKTVYTFKNPIDSSIYASHKMVNDLLNDSTYQLLDTRGLDEYSGEKLKKGAANAGHISTALNLDWAEAVDYNGNHKFLSVDELKSKYSSIGITDDQPIISYCHSGVRSAHTLFVLTELLGYKSVRNYDGSWTEWSHLNPVKN